MSFAPYSVGIFSYSSHLDNIDKNHPNRTGGARTLIGGGGVYIHIFGFCPTCFFCNQLYTHTLRINALALALHPKLSVVLI